ncbi:MAG: PspA/IM30 family protein [Spirochaetaceae bacterium]|nr:MAG: PspA/IM30 family protein [Spirochaetaceae bacterium]
MGLFSRFKRAVKSNINDMISRAENPEKMLNQLIVEMNEQLIESKKTVAAAIADEKKLERQMAMNREQATEWERKAVVAVKAGEDDMAKEALLRKQEYDNTARQYQAQWQAQHESVEQLKGSLRQLQQKIEEAQRKKNLLIARAKRAEAQKRMQQTMSSMVDTSAFEVFDRMAEKVEQIEAEVDAMREIESSSTGDSLERQFQALEASDSTADKLLEDLKAKMAQLEDKTDKSDKTES